MRLASAVALVVVLAGCGTTKHTVSTVTVTVQKAPKPVALGAEDTRYFGQIVSVTKLDATRYLLVLKPELFLVGVTANVAFAQQQGTQCQPLLCPGVDNDHLVLPAGTQQLTFVLPVKTTGTVLTAGGGNFQSTEVSSGQLAAIVGGAEKPQLIEPLESGLWFSVDVDKITSFAQQFQP